MIEHLGQEKFIIAHNLKLFYTQLERLIQSHKKDRGLNQMDSNYDWDWVNGKVNQLKQNEKHLLH